MYDKQLEDLIDVALKDGVITEKEKQVLFKKAEEFGIDKDELDMVLEAKLYENQKVADANEKNTKVSSILKTVLEDKQPTSKVNNKTLRMVIICAVVLLAILLIVLLLRSFRGVLIVVALCALFAFVAKPIMNFINKKGKD